MLKVFAYHKPSPEGLKRIDVLREAFSDIYKVILDTCPDSRERAITLTNLETTAMWAVKAVVHNDPNSEVAT